MDKEMSELLVNLQEKLRKQKSELDWWRTYGEFVSANFNNVDASACSYADGDEE
tara:strand:- start:40 stop:201 length:162 start_codon:yes stop_codon:yes gene_type:complete